MPNERKMSMASLCNDGNGRYRIVFEAPNGKRPSVRLGQVPLKMAEDYRDNIQTLVTCVGHTENIPDPVLKWALKLPSKPYNKLAKNGLLPVREPVAASTRTLGVFLEE